MTVVHPHTIRKLGIITPCVDRTELKRNGLVFTYGLSFAGYDVRVEFDDKPEGHPKKASGQWMDPLSFCLGSTIERFKMPSDMIGVVHDKSSWARRGLAVQNTVIEPGWEGHLTLELSNNSKNKLVIGTGDPIAQIVFHYIAAEPEAGFAEYKGKYQNQERGPQNAR